MVIKIQKKSGAFAENKDVARDIRLHEISPALAAGKRVTLDFADISGATQSFAHALISESIRQYGDSVYDKLEFKNCSQTVQEIINIVADYMEES